MSRPRPVPPGRHLVPGLIAVGLFATMAATVLTAGGTPSGEWAFDDPEGFPDVSLVSGLGYALIGEPAAAGGALAYENTESFLVALLVLAVVLDAALDGALLLASRDGENER